MLELIRPGLLALRRYWKPFVLIQLCAFGVVVAYFSSARVREAADVLAAWKMAGGLLAAMLASAVSGAILPELAKAIAMGETAMSRKRLDDVIFHIVLFGLLGLAGDSFYQLQAIVFGEDGRWITILKKMAVDQFVYSPFLTLPLIVLLIHVRQTGWQVRPAIGELSAAWYLRRVVPLMALCWCYWIPMCVLMYSLPTNLVFCFAMFAQAAWAILMLFTANHPREPDAAAPIVPEEVVGVAG